MITVDPILNEPTTKSLLRAQDRQFLLHLTNKPVLCVISTKMTRRPIEFPNVSLASETEKSKNIHLDNPNSAYHVAAKRLKIMLSGPAVCIYAADIYAADIYAADIYAADIYAADIYAGDIYAADIYAADIYAADIYAADIYAADIYAADIYAADIYAADIYAADIYAADIYAADIYAADIYAADIYAADIYAADIYAADIYAADIYAADIYAADIYYHGHCLVYFNRRSKNDESENPKEELVRHHFISYIRVNICNDKNAYLLNDLLNDAIYMSQEHDIGAIFTNTKSLRRYLEQNFNELGFKKSGKNVIVYSLDIDPILYSESILNGHGLRKNDIIAALLK